MKKENTRLENQLKVEKVDENNEAKHLAGAEFSLYDQKNNLIEKGVTNENGELLFSNLSPDGEYYLVETKAPNGYELDETKHPISFAGKADYTLTYRVKNKQQVQIGSIKIVKQDKESKKRLTGAEFKFRDTTNNYTATFTANRNGEVLIPGLAGDRVYEVTEIKAPNGYIIDRRVHKVDLRGQGGKTYTLVLNNQAQKGAIKIIKQDGYTKQRLTGAEFQWKDTVTGKTGTVTVGTDGTITIPNLSVNRTYEIPETKAPVGYVLDKTVHKVTLTSAQANKVVTVTIGNVAQFGSIQIIKTDRQTGKRLAGAVFEWKDTTNGYTSRIVTDKNGIAKVSGLSVNRTYELKEVIAPSGYHLDSTVKKVELTTAYANRTLSVNMYDLAKRGNLKLVKQDKDSRKRLAGAQFRWRDTANGNTGVVTANNNGEVILYNFSVNRIYEITEIKAPNGYILDKTVHRVLLPSNYAGKTYTFVKNNNAHRAHLKLVKQDGYSKQRLAGAQFRWRDTVNGNTGVVTANANGEATLYNFSVNRIYEITEIKAPNGYILDKTVHRVLLPANYAGKTYTFTKNNQAQKGAIKIIKQDGYTKQRLAGAQFKFRDTINNHTATFTANRNGEVLIPGLAGDRVYEITEIKAPDGYIIDRRAHKVDLRGQGGKTYTLVLNNQAQKGAIKIIKQDVETKARLAGAEFKFRDTINNHTATFTANRNGEVLIPGLAGDRVYEITEIKAPDGYIIDRRAHKVDLRGQGGKTYTLVLNNQAQKGAIKIIKQDGYTKQRLTGAEFQWKDTVTGKTGTVTVGTDGTITIPNLSVNRTYEIPETKAPVGYVLDKTVHKVTLTSAQANKVVTVTIGNVAQFGSIQIIKTDRQTGKRLAGAVFEWKDTTNGYTSRIVTDKNGIAKVSGLSVNRTYELKEVIAPSGYHLDSTVKKVELTTAYANRTLSVNMYDLAKRGNLKLVKQDKDSRKRLAGAQFRWRDTANGNTGVVTANNNGEVILYNFSVNRIYEITEIKAPNGYILDKTVHRVLLPSNYAGKTYTFVKNNNAHRAHLKLVKQDGYSKQRLAGAQFRWRDTVNGNTGVVTANANGEATLYNFSVNRIYEITEIKAPNGYILDKTVHRVLLPANYAGKTYTFTKNNQAQKGAIKIIKQDGYTKQRLAGAQFKFRDTINNHTATFTANRNGEVLIPGLAGDRVYEITEIKAPDGYIIDRRAHKVDLRGQGGKTYTLVLNNQAQKGAIKIIKQDVESKEPLAGAVFEWKDTTNDYTQRVTTGWDGTVTISGLSVNRVYEIREVQAPAGYSRNTTPTRVSLTQNHAGQTIAIVRENRKIPVYNPPPPTYWPGYIPPVTYYNPPVYYNPPKYYYRWCVMVIVVVCW